MAVRETETYPVPGASNPDLHVCVVEVTDPGVGLHVVYEVHCYRCWTFDTYEQRSAAELAGANHDCQAVA